MDKLNRVSSRDVAREAGVSQATVSYVLNNTKGVKIKPETRRVVFEAAKKLNYHPNLIARSMKLKKSMSIGVVTDKNISSYWFIKVLEGVRDVLADRNYSITLCLNKSAEGEYDEHIQYYRSNRIDGIIFVFAALTDEQVAFLVENSIPFVIIRSKVKKDMIHVVKTDVCSAITEAVRYLKKRGIDNIAYMGSGINNGNNRRYMGYLRALSDMGIKLGENTVFQVPDDEEEKEKYIEKCLSELEFVPCAVLCESTNLGFKLLKYAAQYGIRVPEDMAVVGMGTSGFSDKSYPSLSAIEAPLYDMGHRGAEMLLDIINNNEVKDAITLEWSFVRRKSC